MGKLADYLSDTFRAPNEAEWAYEWRRFRQRMIILALFLIFCAICGGLYGLSRLSDNTMMKGTWILQEDYEDGFHPEDRYLEYKGGTYYMNGSRFGKPTRQDGKLIISKHTPSGQRDRTLSFDGNTMTMEYMSTKTPVILSGSSGDDNPAYGGPYGPGSSHALVQQALQGNLVDSRIVETYVRISMECDLTEEQRDELY